jgi:hypothetical protein
VQYLLPGQNRWDRPAILGQYKINRVGMTINR